MSTKTYKAALQICLLVTALLPIFLIGIFSYTYIYQQSRTNVEELNQALAKSVRAEVMTMLSMPAAALRQIASFLQSERFSKELASATEGKDQQIDALLHDSLQNSDFFEAIYLVNQSGIITHVALSSGRRREKQYIGLDLSRYPYFYSLKGNQDLVWSDAFLSMVSGQLSMHVAVPVFDSFLIGSFNIEQLEQLIQAIDTRQKIEIALLDRQGALIFHSSKASAEQKMNYSYLMPVQQAFAGHYGTYTYIDDHKEYIGTISTIENTGWLILISQESQQALAPIRHLRLIYFFALLTSLLFAYIIAAILAKWLTAPLVRFSRMAKLIENGAGDQHLPRFNFQEFENLSQNFLNMQTAIKERQQLLLQSQKELAEKNVALGDAQAFLEKKVNERTQELRQTHAQLMHMEKLGAIGRLSASIAHEINNPLYGIRNVLVGLQRRGNLKEKSLRLVDMAVAECDRIKNLISDLQDFYRPSTATAKQTDIHQVLDSVLLLHKKEFKNKGIHIQREYQDDLPQIQIIGDQIKQVIFNLLANAEEAVASGGNGRIIIRTRSTNDKVFIDVIDNGHGIQDHDMAKIFEPFFTTKSAVKGTGLGLSISYGIIKNHGGNIEVRSKVDEGSQFTIILPVKDAQTNSA